MGFLCGWAWLMRFLDLGFNIMPVPHPDGFSWVWLWLDLACLAFMGGILAKKFLRDLAAHPPYPVRDPRLSEALGHRHPVASPISGGDLPDTFETEEALEEGAVGSGSKTDGGQR